MCLVLNFQSNFSYFNVNKFLFFPIDDVWSAQKFEIATCSSKLVSTKSIKRLFTWHKLLLTSSASFLAAALKYTIFTSIKCIKNIAKHMKSSSCSSSYLSTNMHTNWFTDEPKKQSHLSNQHDVLLHDKFVLFIKLPMIYVN